MWGGGVKGQKLASRAKVWSALSTPTPDFEYSPFLEEVHFPLKADHFHPFKRVADFAGSATLEGN